MTDPPEPDAPVPFTIADAEEWARWAAVHDDWDKTRDLMGVLLGEYERRGKTLKRVEKLAKALEDGTAYRRERFGVEPEIRATAVQIRSALGGGR